MTICKLADICMKAGDCRAQVERCTNLPFYELVSEMNAGRTITDEFVNECLISMSNTEISDECLDAQIYLWLDEISQISGIPFSHVTDEWETYIHDCLCHGMDRKMDYMKKRAAQRMLQLSRAGVFTCNANLAERRLREKIHNEMTSEAYPIKDCVWSNNG